jgi:hypothetical protein
MTRIKAPRVIDPAVSPQSRFISKNYQHHNTMASLPINPFMLHGGCFCKAITYTISVPALSSRPPTQEPPKHPFGPQTEVTERLPIITLDHCNSCRRISGAIIECWFICPQSWATFSLLTRIPNSPSRITTLSTAEVLRPSQALQGVSFIKAFQSSEEVHRTFCGRCGTHLSYYYAGEDDEMRMEENWGEYFDVAVGTFEKGSVEMKGMRPGRESWAGDGVEWMRMILKGGEKDLGN